MNVLCVPSVPLCSPLFLYVPLCSSMFPSVSLCSPLFLYVPLCSSMFPSVPAHHLFLSIFLFSTPSISFCSFQATTNETAEEEMFFFKQVCVSMISCACVCVVVWAWSHVCVCVWLCEHDLMCVCVCVCVCVWLYGIAKRKQRHVQKYGSTLFGNFHIHLGGCTHTHTTHTHSQSTHMTGNECTHCGLKYNKLAIR